jgi:hypothetical protein
MSEFSLNSGTATAVAGAATLNNRFGVVTSEAITTAAGSTYTLTLTNSEVQAGDIAMASVSLGAGSAGTPVVCGVTATAGQLKVVVQNVHASAAFNAAIKITYAVFGQGR